MLPLENSSASHNAGGDAQLRAQHQQVRAQLENKLRIKKLEISEHHRKVGDIERAITQMDGEAHHIEQDIRRIEGELQQLLATVVKEERESKLAEGGMREKDMQLHRQSDETVKLEREIEHLRQEITQKERRIHELKEETREFVRGKEGLRQQFELGHSGATSESTHAHDKNLQLQRFKQELMRKENEIKHKKQEETTLKHELVFKEQDAAGIEAELRRA